MHFWAVTENYLLEAFVQRIPSKAAFLAEKITCLESSEYVTRRKEMIRAFDIAPRLSSVHRKYCLKDP